MLVLTRRKLRVNYWDKIPTPPWQAWVDLLTLRERYASVAELVDALGLGSSGATRGGSIPSARTIYAGLCNIWIFGYKYGELMNTIENLTVDATSLHERELTITVPSSIVNRQFQTALKKVQRVAKRPGFRPGKMPESMVKSFFGAQIQEELVSVLFDLTFTDACKNESLTPVSKPKLTPVGEPQNEKPFVYKALFQVKPKVEVKNYQGLALEITNVAFAEDDVTHELENLREHHATFREPTDRQEITPNDLVSCHSHVSIDGQEQPEYSHKDYSVPLFAENVPDDLRAALVGKKVGDEACVKYTMPEDHQDEVLKGKECEMFLKITSFKERVLPLLDDEFAKDISDKFSSLDDLKDSIRTRFNIMAKRRNDYYRNFAITKALVDNNPVDVPPALVERMAMVLIDQELSNLDKEVASRMVKTHWQEIWDSMQPRALFKAKTGLLFEELIKNFDVKVGDEEIAFRMKEIKDLSREDAEYSLAVDKVIHAIEATSVITIKNEPLFGKGSDA